MVKGRGGAALHCTKEREGLHEGLVQGYIKGSILNINHYQVF